MTRATTRRPPSWIFLPKNITYPKWKVIITAKGVDYTIIESDGDVENNFGLSCNVTRPVTTALSSFTGVIANINGRYVNTFSNGDIISIYADYTDATTQIFKGKLDNAYHNFSQSGEYTIEINGRDYPELSDRKIIKSYSNAALDTAVIDILDTYFSDITFSFWEDSQWKTSGITEDFTTFSYNYRDTGLSALQDILKRGNYDFYLEYDNDDEKWYLRVFTKESKLNTREAFVIGQNILSISGFGENFDDVKNRITGYGNTDNNIIVISTEEDISSQEETWVKEDTITDNNLKKFSDLKEKVLSELTNRKNPNIQGTISSIGTPFISPGEKVWGYAPFCNLSNQYRIETFTHNFSNSGFTTTVNITKRNSQAVLFKERIDAESGLQPYSNLNGMENSITLYFDGTENLILDGVEESTEGYLKLSSGQTSGIMTTPIRTSSNTVTQCELRVKVNFPNQENDIYEVTADGVNWETITLGNLYTFKNVGNSIRLRITLNNDGTYNPIYEKISLLYK